MIDRYIKTIKEHALKGTPLQDIERELTIFETGNLTIEYAPFDYIEPQARVVLVGLTPGRQQARTALSSLVSSFRAGASVPEALETAKKTGSFSGPLRSNLTAMLDHIGINGLLNVGSADDLFEENSRSAHFTSALRYPVFVRGKNYSGSPNPLKVTRLVQMIDTQLAEEAETLPSAIWIPLGAHASRALLRLTDAGKLQRQKVIAGLPHPSGANAERIAYFLGRKGRDQLSVKTRPEPIDDARRALIEQVAAMRAAIT